MDKLIFEAASRASDYLAGLESRRVAPAPESVERLKLLDLPLQDEPVAPLEVLRQLDEIASPATVASAGGRYFGFVIGGSLPAALAANLLAAAWDQNAVLQISSPAASALEEICGKWLLSLLGLPAGSGIGFVTGASMANFVGLASARHALLERLGWDVEARGLFGAPPITVVVGEEAHVTLFKALSLLGLGRERVVHVLVDGQGRMRPDALPQLTASTILCLQAGNVNTGAFDPAAEIIPVAKQAGAWVHVDGAFGLWALACPTRSMLAEGIEGADSWATDAHKWLNVPYDCGLAFVRDPLHLRAAMSASAAYLIEAGQREPSQYVPELSRKARGVGVWAALRSLGRSGLADLVERNCRQAERFAEGLRHAGYEVLNQVVLNQVLVSFGDPQRTRDVIRRVQEDGTCWCGGTEWQGRTAMRVSVSSWATSDADVERCLEAILRIAKG